jgi:hypothetical protein
VECGGTAWFVKRRLNISGFKLDIFARFPGVERVIVLPRSFFSLKPRDPVCASKSCLTPLWRWMESSDDNRDARVRSPCYDARARPMPQHLLGAASVGAIALAATANDARAQVVVSHGTRSKPWERNSVMQKHGRLSKGGSVRW